MRRSRWIVVLVPAVAVAALALAVSPAFAGSPWWRVSSNSRPAVLPDGGSATVVSQAVNVGDGPTAGAITLTDTLPVGVTVEKVEPTPGVAEPRVSFNVYAASPGLGSEEQRRYHESGFGPEEGQSAFHACSEPASRVIQCTYGEFEAGVPPVVKPYVFLELGIAVNVEGGANSGDGRVEVSGGEAPAMQVNQPLKIGTAVPSFGIEESSFSIVPEEVGGGVDAQAGSHPFQLTTSLAFNQNTDPLTPPALPRDLQFALPPGLVGNATSIPQCSDLDFRKLQGGIVDICPNDTAVGVATLTIDEPVFGGVQTISIPVFNLTPGEGEPARFGFEYVGSPVVIDTAVRTGRDYGATVSVSNTTEAVNFLASTVTFWGVPGESSHNESRGWGCLAGEHWSEQAELPCTPFSESRPRPFLTLPTSCAAPFTTKVQGNSWPLKSTPTAEAASIALPAAEYTLADGFARTLGITGCNELPFDPSLTAVPDRQEASSPTGLTVRVHVPQEASENALGLASSSLKGTTVTLPEGLSVNPAGANGLQACSEAQIGFEGEEPSSGLDLFTATLPSPFCPAASKVATVKIKTPLLPAGQLVEGAVYLAAQNENPFGSLIAMYIVAEDPISGVLVKLPLKVSLNQETGQLTSTLENSPQLPFEDAEFHFFGGPRAPLATPARCRTYTTNTSFTPWSGNQPVHSSSSFAITAGPGGGPCPSQLPFTPILAAGATNINGAAFTPLTTTISREDGNQDIQTIQLHYPPGLSGILTGVKLCPETQANAGTCPPESLIGHATASVGLGSEPYTVTGGEVFLTEKYQGSPFGLSIVTPAVAGPFNLGKVIVRARIDIDPHTFAITVTTSSIPHILDGIPLEIKHVNATIDRPAFTVNPTNCKPMAITGTISSVEETTAPVSTPFQAANCASLRFAPKLQVTTSGKTSKANGASLTVKLTYPNNALGSYTNIAKVKVDLPKQLPSRLTTLQKACPAKTFETNPATCPTASIVGHATATTPLLPVPVTGPAYLVSHGNEAFPNLTILLQGYGITGELIGNTYIKKGITSNTFKTTPDVPINTFELTLPEGKFSALAANGNLCKSKLTMPTAYVAQNGLEIHTTTKIGVTGCHKPKTKAKKAPKTHR